MPVLGRHHRIPDSGAGSTRSDPRLVFPPLPTVHGVLDGSWWPRTRDPAAELPGLIAAVTGRLGVVSRIALNAGAWDARPQCIMTVGQQVVRLDWSGGWDAHRIRVTGCDGAQLDLLVIPPGTARVLALSCLAIAAGQDRSPSPPACPGSPAAPPPAAPPLPGRSPAAPAPASIAAPLTGAGIVVPGSPAGLRHSTGEGCWPSDRLRWGLRRSVARTSGSPHNAREAAVDIVMTGRHVDVPAHYRVHVAGKLARLERYDSYVIRYDVEWVHENNPRQSKACHRVEITGTGQGATVRAGACGPDFYTALDAAVGKLEARLRRSHDRRVHHGRHQPTSVTAATAPTAALRADPGASQPIMTNPHEHPGHEDPGDGDHWVHHRGGRESPGVRDGALRRPDGHRPGPARESLPGLVNRKLDSMCFPYGPVMPPWQPGP